MSEPLIVALVGQTPPPFHGQAMMTQYALAGSYPHTELHHIRLAFSKGMEEVGTFALRKVPHIGWVLAQLAYVRIRRRARVLYYHPAGPNRLPMYRDLFLLGLTRWMFKATILHFHAGGVSHLYSTLSPLLKFLFRKAYFHPHVAIRTSSLAPNDASFLEAIHEIVIPNAVPDVASAASPSVRPQPHRAGSPPTILFVGVLRETKGVLVLLRACQELLSRGLLFRLELVGAFSSPGFQRTMTDLISRSELAHCTALLGELTGEQKSLAYRRASIFCYPTFFEAETFGLVLLEAMQFGLPVVATRWRGIPSVIIDGANGLLVPINDSMALADRLEELLGNDVLARRMGASGRQLFEQKYTLPRFHRDLQQVFDSLREEFRLCDSSSRSSDPALALSRRSVPWGRLRQRRLWRSAVPQRANHPH